MTLLLAWLLAGPIYHAVTIDSFAASHHTHVAVVGTVAWVKREADGDLHIRLRDAHGHFIIGEIVPGYPLPAPPRGARITLRGIRRFDDERGHGWWEVHPVFAWERTNDKETR